MEKGRIELESDAKRKFAEWIRANAPGYNVIEIKTAGFPDRCVIGPKRFVLWLEFKRERGPSKTGAKRQEYYRNLLEEFGFAVEVVKNKASAIEAYRRRVRA